LFSLAGFNTILILQVTFIFIALFTIQIVSKQLHSENNTTKFVSRKNCVIVHQRQLFIDVLQEQNVVFEFWLLIGQYGSGCCGRR